jgi:hypothetical protein
MMMIEIYYGSGYFDWRLSSQYSGYDCCFWILNFYDYFEIKCYYWIGCIGGWRKVCCPCFRPGWVL